MKTKLLMVFFCTIIHFLLYIFRAICIYSTKTTIMNQNENSNLNEDVLQHSSGVRNQLGGSTQGGNGPYQRTPANYAGGPGPHANSTITLYAQK
jgi:hypothetical protein